MANIWTENGKTHMDMQTFKVIHSELIMSVQYIEQDLRIIFSMLRSGSFEENFNSVDSASLGKLLRNLHGLDEELGFQKIKDSDYELLDEIREIRNYWCHQCYIDFHYITDEQKHFEKFEEIADRLHNDELRVFDLQQKMEKLRISVVTKYRNKKK